MRPLFPEAEPHCAGERAYAPSGARGRRGTRKLAHPEWRCPHSGNRLLHGRRSRRGSSRHPLGRAALAAQGNRSPTVPGSFASGPVSSFLHSLLTDTNRLMTLSFLDSMNKLSYNTYSLLSIYSVLRHHAKSSAYIILLNPRNYLSSRNY